MDLRQRLTGINSSGWFLIIFFLLLVGGMGYALGTKVGVDDKQKDYPGHYHNHSGDPVPEQDQTTQPLQAQPSDIQGGNSELPPTGPSNPQETPVQPPADDLIYPYDPGYCNPRKPTMNRECIY